MYLSILNVQQLKNLIFVFNYIFKISSKEPSSSCLFLLNIKSSLELVSGLTHLNKRQVLLLMMLLLHYYRHL